MPSAPEVFVLIVRRQGFDIDLCRADREVMEDAKVLYENSEKSTKD
jgi:hypothetical protein